MDKGAAVLPITGYLDRLPALPGRKRPAHQPNR